MEIQQDFKDLLELFNAHKVEYIIVGGYALAFHGAPRYNRTRSLYYEQEGDGKKKRSRRPGSFGCGIAKSRDLPIHLVHSFTNPVTYNHYYE